MDTTVTLLKGDGGREERGGRRGEGEKGRKGGNKGGCESRKNYSHMYIVKTVNVEKLQS